MILMQEDLQDELRSNSEPPSHSQQQLAPDAQPSPEHSMPSRVLDENEAGQDDEDDQDNPKSASAAARADEIRLRRSSAVVASLLMHDDLQDELPPISDALFYVHEVTA